MTDKEFAALEAIAAQVKARKAARRSRQNSDNANAWKRRYLDATVRLDALRGEVQRLTDELAAQKATADDLSQATAALRMVVRGYEQVVSGMRAMDR